MERLARVYGERKRDGFTPIPCQSWEIDGLTKD